MIGGDGVLDGPSLQGRVLVVDDDPANVALLERMLMAAGYEDVASTGHPTQVADALAATDPDLLLLDWHMRPASGADVLRALRADPRWAALPVIVVTADPDARLQALELEATDFLTKPFDHAEILLRVRNVLRVRALHRALQASNEELEQRVRERTLELEITNDRLREADALRRDFIAMASHEMRTPLTVIRGFSDHWQSRGFPSPDSAGEQSRALGRNVRRMEHLVHNLLLASRVETAGGRHRRRSFDLCDVVRSAVSGTVTSGHATVTCDVEDRFDGDPELLALVVGNLVSNAEQYGASPIEVVVRASPGGVDLTVADHGPGVPEEFVPRLFGRFAQATVGDRRTARGAGIGLWVSRHIVEMHGGRIGYESPPGGGARFLIRLPRLGQG